MYQLVDLRDKNILVVGASSGIGRATAVLLSKLGAHVMIVARREEMLKETLAMLEGEGHTYLVCDVCEESCIAEVVKEMTAKHGLLDGAVYAVGASIDVPVAMLSVDKLISTYRTNLFPFVEMIKQCCKKGRYNVGMSIVGISSIASRVGESGRTLYSSSKAGMDAVARCAAKEYASRGVRINTVMPAMIQTDMYERFLLQIGGEDAAACKRWMERQYLGLGEPDDVANAVAYLLSDAAKFITGASIPIDGGYYSN